MTKRPAMMGIMMYKGSVLIGKAIDLTMDGDVISVGLGIIDRFEVLRYLSPRVARDLIGEKPITEMPELTLYCEGGSIKTLGKKKPSVRKEETTRITFKPESIEIIPMPGQNLSLKSLKGSLVGSIESGVDAPKTVTPEPPAVSYEPTVLY